MDFKTKQLINEGLNSDKFEIAIKNFDFDFAYKSISQLIIDEKSIEKLQTVIYSKDYYLASNINYEVVEMIDISDSEEDELSNKVSGKGKEGKNGKKGIETKETIVNNDKGDIIENKESKESRENKESHTKEIKENHTIENKESHTQEIKDGIEKDSIIFINHIKSYNILKITLINID